APACIVAGGLIAGRVYFIIRASKHFCLAPFDRPRSTGHINSDSPTVRNVRVVAWPRAHGRTTQPGRENSMLRYSLVFVVGVCATARASAAAWAGGMFDELSRDFGSVPRGPMLNHPFRLTNSTGAPVEISQVRVSCGCVSARALTNYLRPGESTAILADM